MANGNLLQQLGQGFASFATRTPLSQIQDAAEQRQVLGRIQNLQPGQAVQSGQLAQLATINPEMASKLSGVLGGISQQRQGALFNAALAADRALSSGNIPKAKQIVANRLDAIVKLGGDPADTAEIAALLDEGTPESIAQATSLVRSTVEAGQLAGFLPKTPGRKFLKAEKGRATFLNPDGTVSEEAVQGAAKEERGERGASQREFETLIANFTPKERREARRVKAGIKPRRVGSSVQTITEQGTAAAIAETEETIASAKESGKAKSRLRFEPQIRTAVKLAEAEAAARGETLTNLARSEAALPGLLESVGQLKDLAVIATSTIGGRIFDAAVKESGFGSTKGADANAKFIAIVNNQVLPLLRPTFGSAFTEREGETLKATMGDPNASPAQKLAQLEAFIDQKVRDIQTSQRELGKEVGSPVAAAGGGQEVTTQAEFDALPSGAVFTENGQQFRKP